jgi:hypothetical protein
MVVTFLSWKVITTVNRVFVSDMEELISKKLKNGTESKFRFAILNLTK